MVQGLFAVETCCRNEREIWNVRWYVGIEGDE